MNFNLFNNLKSQARSLSKTIRNLSPRVVDVITPVTIPSRSIQKKVDKYFSGKNSDLIRTCIISILKDKDSKEKLYAQQDKLSKESTYDVLLDQFVEDAFGIDPDDKVVSVEILDNDIDMREILEVFPADALERTEFDEILTENLKNRFLKYGELFLRKKYENRHRLVVEFEILDGRYIFPICTSNHVLFYLKVSPCYNDFDIIDPKDIIAFQLNPRTCEIVNGDKNLESLLCNESEEVKALIPNEYKIGTPLLYNARRELANLRLANLLTDLAQLKGLATPTLLAVNVENIRDEEQLSELIDTYEEYLEDALQVPDMQNIDSTDDMELDALLNTTIKVLPVEGSGKNGLSTVDVNSSTDTSDEYLQRKREAVAFAAGFPLSAVSNDTNETSKTDLASNRRYRNKCKSAQRYIVRPTKEWIIEDFDLQSIDINSEQIRVFCKPIVSLDTAEDLEISLGAITQASQVYEALLTISDSSQKYEIDEDGYYDYFNTLLSPFKGAQKLLKRRDEDTDIDDNVTNNDKDRAITNTFTDTNRTLPVSNLDRVGITEDLDTESDSTVEIENFEE